MADSEDMRAGAVGIHEHFRIDSIHFWHVRVFTLAQYHRASVHVILLVHSLTWFQMIIQVSQLLLSPVALIFCGHLGDTIQLDGAALAISVSTID